MATSQNQENMRDTWDKKLHSSFKWFWITNPSLRILLMAGAPSNWLNYLKCFSAIISIESLIVYAFWSLMAIREEAGF